MSCPHCGHEQFSTRVTCRKCHNRLHKPARHDGVELGAADGWTALRKEIARGIREARREKSVAMDSDDTIAAAVAVGEIAALSRLGKSSLGRKTVPPIDQGEPPPNCGSREPKTL